MHKVFISYHHDNDQEYKTLLSEWGVNNNIFIDRSVGTNDISDDLDDQQIRRIIRDEKLQDSTITIVLLGTETWGRKHIDWEIYSSMIDGSVNKKSGVIGIVLPSTNSSYICAGGLDTSIFGAGRNWVPVSNKSTLKQSHPYFSERLIDNLSPNPQITVFPWSEIVGDAQILISAIETAYSKRSQRVYDFSTPMRRNNAERYLHKMYAY